jgi:ABC-type nickel/cobalt efflux system permease component RcnA
VLGTRAVLVGVALAVLAQLAFTYLPALQTIFGSRSVSLRDGALILGIGAALLVILEVEKWIRRAVFRRRAGTRHLQRRPEKLIM